MSLHHFRVFLTVCEAGTMTQAARQLYMTQPSVSQVISELEREYSVRLFERMNHRLYLTSAGAQLRSYASHILNLSEQAKNELTKLGDAGTLRVGASQTIGAHLLPEILREYGLAKPDVEIFSVVDNTRLIENLILEDQIDLGIVEGAVHSKYILQEKLCEDDLVIICGKGHPFRKESLIDITNLAEQPFIIREPGSGTRDLFERIMNDAGVSWKIAGVYNNTEAIKKAVGESLAIAVVPKISIVEEKKQGVLKEVPVEGLNLRRKFILAYHQDKYLTNAILSFIETCKKITTIPNKSTL